MKKYQVPAISYAVIYEGEIVEVKSKGVMIHRSLMFNTKNRRLPIMSLTKSFTSALAAVLVQEGVISWDTTLNEVFTNINVHAGYKEVTLKQLLSHTAGLPHGIYFGMPAIQLSNMNKTPLEAREFVVKDYITHVAQFTVGKFKYSNSGYIIAASMMENITGIPYEELLYKKILEPLGLQNTMFYSYNKNNIPLGHDENMQPVFYDMPSAYNSAGKLLASIEDLAKWVVFQIEGHNNGHAILKKEYFLNMHTPIESDYCLGWGTYEVPWADEKVYEHYGSNMKNHSAIWFLPKKRFGIVVYVNVENQKACNEVGTFLIEKYLGYKNE